MGVNKFAYGVKSIEASAIDAVTGLATSLADVGEVYRDSAEITVDDPTTTQHFSEFDEDPVVSTSRKGMMNLSFNLMDTSADKCLEWMGGNVVEAVGEPDIWEAPAVQPDMYKAIDITFENGSKLRIYRGKVMAKLVPNPTKPGFTVIEVMVQPVKPLVAALPAYAKIDAVAPA